MADGTLSLEQFLSTATEKETKEFLSEVWTTTDANGEVVPGKLIYRMATVGDRERARQFAKHGEKFDNAKYGCKLISLCLIEPKVPEIYIDELKQKNGKECDRLLAAIVGEENPR